MEIARKRMEIARKRMEIARKRMEIVRKAVPLHPINSFYVRNILDQHHEEDIRQTESTMRRTFDGQKAP